MVTPDPLPDPPGPRGLPFVGNTLQLARDPLGFPERCRREYGDVVTVRFADQSAVLLNHPDHCRHVLADRTENYWKGEYFNRQLSLLGDGLFASDGEFWRQRRRLMQPIFHPDELASYGGGMVEATERQIDRWTPGVPTDISAEMMSLALRNVTNALFSADVVDDVPEIASAIGAVMRRFNRSRRMPVSLPEWLPTPGKYRYRRAVASFHEVVGDIIEEHNAAADPPDDVVTMLLAAGEAGEGLTERQVRDQVLELLLAGHDTSGLGLTYLWYLLATHPEVEARLVDELQSVLDGRPPTMADLSDLPYLERVVKEVLRLYPPVYFFVREPYEDDVIGGYRIPAGSLIAMYQWVLHRDERFYDDPETFDPSRWTDAFERELHPYAYMPFGGGPRRCIGDGLAMMEIRLVAATIAQRYRLELDIEPPLSLSPLLTLRPSEPVRMVPRER